MGPDEMKRALVTGANRGIGLAIAKGLVDRGHEVLPGGRPSRFGLLRRGGVVVFRGLRPRVPAEAGVPSRFGF